LVGAVVSGKVEEAESEVGMLLRYDFSSRHLATSQSTPRTRVNESTTPALSTSCLVARAAGKPLCWPMGAQARSGVGAAPTQSLASLLAERLPEFDMQPGGPYTSQRVHDMRPGCSIRHMHRGLRSHNQRRDAHGDWGAQRIAFTRHRAISLATYKRLSLSTPDAGSRLPIGRPFAWVHVPSRRVTPGCPIWFVSSLTPLD
jgi:hypothetical protein